MKCFCWDFSEKNNIKDIRAVRLRSTVKHEMSIEGPKPFAPFIHESRFEYDLNMTK